jgi:hypothetical protein
MYRCSMILKLYKYYKVSVASLRAFKDGKDQKILIQYTRWPGLNSNSVHPKYNLAALILLFFNWYCGGGGGVQLGPLDTAATNSSIMPAPGDYDDGEIGGMIYRENRSTRRKPAPVPLCPPQISRCSAWTRTQAAAVGSQWLTAWAMTRPISATLLLRQITRRIVVLNVCPIWRRCINCTVYTECFRNTWHNFRNEFLICK